MTMVVMTLGERRWQARKTREARLGRDGKEWGAGRRCLEELQLQSTPRHRRRQTHYHNHGFQH